MQIAQALRQTTRPFVSLEFFPPAAESHLPDFYETVERLRSIDPLFLSVTYGAGGGKQQNTLNVTAELARRGFTVMAHLTCVGLLCEIVGTAHEIHVVFRMILAYARNQLFSADIGLDNSGVRHRSIPPSMWLSGFPEQ